MVLILWLIKIYFFYGKMDNFYLYNDFNYFKKKKFFCMCSFREKLKFFIDGIVKFSKIIKKRIFLLVFIENFYFMICFLDLCM